MRLKRNGRFGFANDENPSLAMIDFVFESAYYCLRSKLEDKSIEWKPCFETIRELFKNESIFSFFVFAFLIDFRNIEENAEQHIIAVSKYAVEVSNALNQIVQNALQHSSEKSCVITFMRDDFCTTEETDSLRIMISDLSTKTILKSFSEVLQRENDLLNRVFKCDLFEEKLKGIKTEIIKANNMLSKTDIELKNFFNSFDSSENELVKAWYDFRQTDSSAHIGLALFAHIMKKSGAKFSVCSNSSIKFNSKNYYCSSNDVGKHAEYVIPGTEFEITLPLWTPDSKNPVSMAQLNFNKNYYDDYQTYAQFIDSDLQCISINKKSRDNINTIIKMVQSHLRVNKLDKFSSQLIWSDFWFKIFMQCNLGKEDNKIYYINFSEIPFSERYISSNRGYEIIVKGLISALGYYSSLYSEYKVNLAIINISEDFLECFEDVTLSLSLKKFPENLQLFITDSKVDSKENKQLHLFGTTYGEAIQNAYVLSIGHGVQCYNSKVYSTIKDLFQPFDKYVISKSQKTFVVPFTMFLPARNSQLPNMFFEKLSTAAEAKMEGIDEGYKFYCEHIRLGNKVHTNQFYEMSFLFYRTIIANRVAFEILRSLKNDMEVNLLTDNILFYGYASYSQAILMSIMTILKLYREKNNSTAEITYAVYQYNLQSEAMANNIQIYYKDYEKFKNLEEVKVIQIVPISSTLTTFSKMWIKFRNEYNNLASTHILSHNHTVIWVRDDIDKKSKESKDLVSADGKLTRIEEMYYKEPSARSVEINFDKCEDLEKCNMVNYIFRGYSYWQSPEKCKHCYPDDVTNEVPLIETDPTSTIPSQQIYPKKKNTSMHNIDVDENNKRIALLKGFVYYGHVRRGKNHYQYYINTQDYFAKVSNHVKEWLEMLRKSKKQTPNHSFLPCLNVIFSPEHNTNVGFSQYVNAFYFKGTAEIISINEEKEFRSNFICEHTALKNTIKTLFDNFYYTDKSPLPVKFYFVDDDIITGSTLHKASNLLQSLIPQEYLNIYTTGVFEKCFFLIDRISDSTKASYVIPTNKFHSFCHIDVSNMRKQGDSCIGCKLLADSQRLMHRSATRSAADYWSSKVKSYEPKSFEKISGNDACKDVHYYRLVLSHIVRNLFNQNIDHSNEVYRDMVFELFEYFLTDEEMNKQYHCYIKKISKHLIDENVNKRVIIQNLIKIITRPFITFNYRIKQEVLRFIVLLCERIVDNDFDLKYTSLTKVHEKVINDVVVLFNSNPSDLVYFLKKYLFKALTDLHSTYIIRKNTIIKTLRFINSVEMKWANQFDDEKKFQEELEEFWLTYSFYVQKVIDGSSDETRTLWLEHLMVTGNEKIKNFNEIDSDDCGEYFSNRIKSCVGDSKYNYAFELFCCEIFLSNGHLNIDAMSQTYNKNKKENISDSYFVKRLCDFRNIDKLCFDKEVNFDDIKPVDKEIGKNESDLYKCLTSLDSMDSKKFGKNLIRERYDKLLNLIEAMLNERYGLKKEDVRLAILTKSDVSGNKTIHHRDFEIIKANLSSANRIEMARSKYTIRERIIKAILETPLENMGYYMCLASDDEKDAYEKDQSKDINWEKMLINNNCNPYFVLRFDITKDMAEADLELRDIVTVYLYMSIVLADKKKRKMMPWFIMRDILSYRNSILKNYLVEDFTSDVMQRYAHTIDKEAILEHEKVISHSPMKDDKELLKVLRLENDSILSFEDLGLNSETMLKWIFARNYCNTMIAKLYNRVIRNINKDFSTIVNDSEKELNREATKLYVPENYFDGNSAPIDKISDILPNFDNHNEETDYMYKLFSHIIEFQIKNEDKLRSASVITKKYENNIEYTYNLDYTKNIIYRICLDSLRFSHGAGAGVNDFYSRIINHYEYNYKRKKYEQVKGDMQKRLLKSYSENTACEVIFDIEESDCSEFDWLIIKNKMAVPRTMTSEELKSKLVDPLDFTDGHMSLLTEKEFFSKLLDKDFEEYINDNMFRYDGEYFETRLPIIKKERDDYEESYMD